MARLPSATSEQFADLMRQSGLPQNTPQTNAFRTLAHAPRIAAPVLRLVLALLTETDLDPRLRELVILQVAQRCEGGYVWVQHVPIAAIVGVDEAQIKALERGAAPPSLFVDRERTMFAFVDEVLDTYTVRDETFVAVREMFSAGEILELLLLIGYFRMVSSVMATLQVELEPSFGKKILDMVRETACR